MWLLIGSAIGAFLIAIMFSLGLRGVGGWVHVHRARRGRGDAGEPAWDEIPSAFKGWYFGVPIFVGYAVLAAIGGVILIHAST
jgi:hypothetical protein